MILPAACVSHVLWHDPPMKVTPDSTHRIVLTKEIRSALNLRPGQSLEVSITPGAVLLTPVTSASGKLVRKRSLKVYTGKIPNIDVEEAVGKARHYTRL
jgi:bifunctional DNA-binding transcriptional regulator/antitoxin component of YhaV-PrlF toxin-antitoxin module